MKRLNADQALAIKDRKDGGVGRGGGLPHRPRRTLAKLRYLFASGTHILKGLR